MLCRKYGKMGGNCYLAVLLVIFANNVLLVTCFEGPHCFNYTWPASSIDNKNCTKHNKNNPYTPCMTPYDSEFKPNTTQLWEEAQTNESKHIYFCLLEADNVCIRYTYMYNGAIANVTYFCGKVVEDRTKPVTTGCYTQRTDGFTVEACVCQTRGHNMPCNTAIRNTYTILIIIMATAVSLFIYKIL